MQYHDKDPGQSCKIMRKILTKDSVGIGHEIL